MHFTCIVTEKSTTEQKAKIRKLTSDDLDFLGLTNLNLNELYKLKEMRTNRTFAEHTYNNLTIIENMPVILENSTSSAFEVPILSVIESSISNKTNTIPYVSNSDKNDRVKDILESDIDSPGDKGMKDLHHISELNLQDLEP